MGPKLGKRRRGSPGRFGAAIAALALLLVGLVMPATALAGADISGEGMLISVDLDARTVTADLRGTGRVTLNTDDRTKIRREKEQGLAALQPGDTVKVKYLPATMYAMEIDARVQSPVVVAIGSPLDLQKVRSTITVQVLATSNKPLSKVEYSVDGGAYSAMSLNRATRLYEAALNTSPLTDGVHSLAARAIDVDGLKASAQSSFVVDNTLPTVSIESPSEGAVVDGMVTVNASASDISGIATVGLWVDGGTYTVMTLGDNGLYQGLVDATVLLPGAHTLGLRAIDTVGNYAYDQVTVTVDGVKIMQPAASSILEGTAVFGALVSFDAGIASVDLAIDGAYYGPMALNADTGLYEANVDTTTLAGGSHVFTVAGSDVAGKTATDETSAFCDNAAPVVAIVSPAAAAIVGGVMNVVVDASDDWAVDEAIYAIGLLEEHVLLNPDTLQYEAVIDTTLLASGLNTLTITVGDLSGKITVASVDIFVDNAAPTVSIVAPPPGAVNPSLLQASAADDWGVASVEYSIDGGLFAAMTLNEGTGLYEAALSSDIEGAYSITVRATDLAGKTAEATLGFVVDTMPPTVALISPDPAEPEVLAGLPVLLQADAWDSMSGVAMVDWQVVMLPAGIEPLPGDPAPEPDAAAWQASALNPDTGLWEATWVPPLTVSELAGYLYLRATDATGQQTVLVTEVGVGANGREFNFTSSSGVGRLRGMVAIEPIGEIEPYRVGVEFRGDNLVPGGLYTVTLVDAAGTISASFVAGPSGTGMVSLEADTTIADEFAGVLTISGPGF